MPREGKGRELDDRVRCVHMLDAAKQAMEFTADRSRSDLDTDHMLRRAVKDCIQEIGEAASKVAEPSRTLIPDLPWVKIIGMRHILVHVYHDIDRDAVWNVVIEDLPTLAQVLEDALANWSEK